MTKNWKEINNYETRRVYDFPYEEELYNAGNKYPNYINDINGRAI